MKIIAIIPARFASTRFPGKPLALIGGKPMIQHVYEQARGYEGLAEVIVATDDDRIAQAVTAFGGRVAITHPDHPSGTDRIAEVARTIPDADVVVNIQGDEPFVQRDQLTQLCRFFDDPAIDIATLAHPITSLDGIENPNIVKVVRNTAGRALYFSRSPIPYLRGVDRADWPAQGQHFQHIGMYAYRRSVLLDITQLPPAPLELAESLEQLRWLSAGYAIAVGITGQPSIGVDTPEDLIKANAWIAQQPSTSSANIPT